VVNGRLWVAYCILRIGIFVLAASVGARAQVSPGPLSRAHQQLEGVTRCAGCHDFGAGSRRFKCLECHTEIQGRVQAHTGFHGRAYKSSSGQTDCARCHMEHNGATFALVRVDRPGFDHLAQTGFPLEGKHRELACQSCHNGKRLPPAARAEIKLKDADKSFLGLQRECAFCHQDQHRGQLGQQCADCHTKEAWKPAQGFNHERTHFPLTGQHQSVACQKCHAGRSGEPAMQFTGLVTNGCRSCHTDPHRGAFREAGLTESCDRCHNTSGWKNSRPALRFDHSVTKFPLTGKHAERACADCHKGSDFHRPIAHDQCQDCHTSPHGSQFTARAAGSDCESCHSVAGFKPARFDRDAHRQSAFPLEGKHAAVECAKCHVPAGRDTVYRTGKLVCSACHEDRHAGQFEARYGNQCQFCHTVDGFQPSTFTLERHAKTGFPLTGHHASTACADCHKLIAQDAPARQYQFASETCNACHVDPHRTKLACETCHGTSRWKDVRPFDHVSTGFRLIGEHEKAKCIDCHAEPGAASAKPVFSRTANQCFACHAKNDPHGGQFVQPDRVEDCSSCHTPQHWSPDRFAHDRTRFPLDVAHRNVTCAKCHKAAKQVDGKAISAYRGTSMECVRCH